MSKHRLRKAFFIILIGLVSLIILIFATTAVISVIRPTWTFSFDDTDLEIRSPTFALPLGVRMSGVSLENPAISISAQDISIQLTGIAGFNPFIPKAAVKIDSLYAYTKGGNTTQQSSAEKRAEQTSIPDCIPLPQISVPALVSLRLESGVFHSTSPEDTNGGFSAHLRNLRTRIRKGDVRIRIRQVTTSLSPDHDIAVQAAADWSDSLSLTYNVDISHSTDSLRLAGMHSKENLLVATDSLFAIVADLRTYASLIPADTALPLLRNIRANVRIEDLRSLEFSSIVTAVAESLDMAQPFVLGPQNLAFSLAMPDDTLSWEFEIEGTESSERIAVSGDLTGIPAKISDITDLDVSALTATGQGGIRNISLLLGDSIITTTVSIPRFRATSRKLTASVATVDGSDIRARVDFGDPLSGTFDAKVAPNEKWVRFFVDTNVTYETLYLAGGFSGEELTAKLRAYQVLAYGVNADSLFARNIVTSTLYRLDSARVFGDSVDWDAYGVVRWAPEPLRLDFSITNPFHGSATFSMRGEEVLQARAQNLDLRALPYPLLRQVDPQQITLDADFFWNQAVDSGTLDAQASALYNEQQIAATIQSRWNKDSAVVDSLVFTYGDSKINAEAVIGLDGKSLQGLSDNVIEKIRMVRVQSRDLQLGPIVSLASPQSEMVRRGALSGTMVYRKDEGLDGKLRIDSLVVAAGGLTPVVEYAVLSALGDSLGFTADISLPSVPLEIDTIRAVVGSPLEEDTIDVQASVAAEGKTRMMFRGKLDEMERIRGTLSIHGKSLRIPAINGSLRNLDVATRMDIPFDSTVTRLTVKSDTFNVTYVNPDLGTQTVTAELDIDSGIALLKELRIISDDTRQAAGRFEYNLVSGDILEGYISGESFGLAWQHNRFELSDFRVAIVDSSGRLGFSGMIEKADFAYYQAPLVAEGRLRSTRFTYMLPPSGPEYETGNGAPPRLSAQTILDSSLIRYRLPSIQTIPEVIAGMTKPTGYTFTNPISIDAQIRTRGNENRLDADILKIAWTGNINLRGTYPYPVLVGQVSALEGTIGAENQTYDIQSMRIRWLQESIGDGAINLEAAKMLAVDCESGTTDSCTVFAMLDGELTDMQFSYRTDCAGEFGAGADISALVFSVQRGCYSSSSPTSGSNLGVRALSLLEPQISQGLTRFARQYVGDWIATTEITGLGSFAADSAVQPVSLEISTKRFPGGFNIRASAGYLPSAEASQSPWEYRLGLQWHPPFLALLGPGPIQKKLSGNLRMEASVETDPENKSGVLEEDEISTRFGVFYDLKFWRIFSRKDKKKNE